MSDNNQRIFFHNFDISIHITFQGDGYENNSFNSHWQKKRCCRKSSANTYCDGAVILKRLGIHDGVLENCSDTGLLILELVGKKEDNKEIARKVALITGVSSQLVELSSPSE